MNLNLIGMNQQVKEMFAPYIEQGFTIGRVALEHKRMYRVWTENGEPLCEVSGKFSYVSFGREDYPAVGDWVVLQERINENRGTIHAILPRMSKFSRKSAGRVTEEQIVAANVDTIFLVNSLNEDLNLRRLERYLLLTWESGANPVIILSKADLCENIAEKVMEVESVALGVPIIAISALENDGIDKLQEFLQPGKTVALLGSSGVGKSTITNILLGEEKQTVQEIRTGDDKGKHTTTHREMILLPNGSVLIDTPGMRELQLWESNDGVSESFSDIEGLTDNCRFRDCKHEKEPGCAVREAIENGELPVERLHSYKKLLKELAYLDRKVDKKAQSDEKKQWKNISKQMKHKVKK
ncbi:ribosome small subunit-dependent GTPase A [Bacillus sp. CGMCC 1.16607]|uniref:ribosome small subunit-dependent GTPase A n=1 Tax=Bacillus sp. CGMCC 1.16607 TaxID=3351842 RepID=UPI00363C7263